MNTILGFTTAVFAVFVFLVSVCGKLVPTQYSVESIILDANLAAMSIDLGSEFMKIGLVKPGVPMEIVLNKESRRKTPNIVAFRNGERFFGDVAAQMVIIQSLKLDFKPFRA